MASRTVSFDPLWCMLLFSLALSACTTSQLITAEARLPPTSDDGSASAFLADPRYRKVVLSPGGTRIEAIRSTGQSDSIVVVEVGQGGRERLLVEEKRKAYRTRGSRVLRQLGWPSDDRIVYSIETPYLSEEDGLRILNDRGANPLLDRRYNLGGRGRKTRLYSIGLLGERRYLGKRWPRAEFSVSQDRIIDWLPNDPDHFLVEYRSDALRVNATTGSWSVVEKFRNGIGNWVADHTGEIRSSASFRDWPREKTLYARRSSEEVWQRLIKFDRYASTGFRFAGFSHDPRQIYVYSDQNSDTTGLYEFDLDRNAIGREIFRDPEYDLHLGWLQSSPVNGRLLAIHYFRDRHVVHVVDPDWQRTWDVILDRFSGQHVDVESQDASGQKMLLRVSSDQSAPSIYFHDSQTGVFELLIDLYPDLRQIEMAPMEPFRFKARDGLEIQALVTRLRGQRGQANPVILFLHDGPATRDVVGWDSVVQFLAHQGFTIVQINYRGSAGFGRDHERRGDLEWGGAVLDDINDAANWLIGEGLAERGQIGIFGIGYGGYLALQSLVKSPDLYQAGASWGGTTDLLQMRTDDRGYMWVDSVSDILIGDVLKDRARLIETSPVHQADRIKAAVLLGHGTEDPAVNPKFLDSMAKALRSADAKVEAYRYENELDEFIDEGNRIDFYRRLAHFFDRHLKGR